MKKKLFTLLVMPLLAFSACTNGGQKEKDYKTLILNYTQKQLELGKTTTLSVKSGLPDSSSVVTWISSNNNIAYVDETGLVYAYKEGECTITGFVDDNKNGQLDDKEYYGECKITDILHSGVNLTVSALKVNLEMEHTASISAYVTPAPESGNYFYLSFNSDNSKVAYAVKSSDYNTKATIKASGIGKTNITVKYGGQAASFEVEVTPWIEGDKTHVASIAFDQENVVLRKTGSENPQLSTNLTILPNTATDKTVTYSSNNPEVASVDNNGIVTGLKGGSALITAKSKDQNKTSTMKVVVQDTYSTYSLTETNYSSYYSGLTEWENGEDLINQLHDIIKDDNPLTYGWDNMIAADRAIDNELAIDAVYTPSQMLVSEQTSGFNREHAFCASLMTGFTTGDAVAQKGRATDLHNLFAASVSGNSSRNNKNFGYADTTNNNYTKEEDYSYDNKNFEPGDGDKGRLARAIFYMATMYNEDVEANVPDSLDFKTDDPNADGSKSKTVRIIYTQKALNVREEYADYSKVSFTKFHYHEDEETKKLYNQYVTLPEGEYSFQDLLDAEAAGYGQYSTDNCVFAIGGLSDLLAWTSFDVNYQEMKRNSYVESAQGNRNPFIDFPELVNYAFGELKDQPGRLENMRNSYEILDCNPDEDLCYSVSDYKQECAVGYTFTKDNYTLQRITKDLAVHTDVPEDADLFEGYTFTNTDLKVGTKTISIPTTLNTIKLKIKVISGDIELCNYSHKLTGTAAGGDMRDFVSGNTVELSGIEWKISWTNASDTDCKPGSTYKGGVAFGKGSHGVGTITFETVEDIEDLTAIYARVNCASGKKVNYQLLVGETVVGSGDYTGTGQNSDPIVIGADFEAMTGPAKIVISGAADFAVHMHTLALKY